MPPGCFDGQLLRLDSRVAWCARGLMVMLREAHCEKDTNLESQTEESTDNQLNVYAGESRSRPWREEEDEGEGGRERK